MGGKWGARFDLYRPCDANGGRHSPDIGGPSSRRVRCRSRPGGIRTGSASTTGTRRRAKYPSLSAADDAKLGSAVASSLASSALAPRLADCLARGSLPDDSGTVPGRWPYPGLSDSVLHDFLLHLPGTRLAAAATT